MRNILKKLALLLVPVAAYFAVFLAFEPNNYFGLHKVTDSESSISRLKAFQREKGSRVIIGDSRLAHFDLDLAGQASGKTWQTLAFGDIIVLVCPRNGGDAQRHDQRQNGC